MLLPPLIQLLAVHQWLCPVGRGAFRIIVKRPFFARRVAGSGGWGLDGLSAGLGPDGRLRRVLLYYESESQPGPEA